MVIFVLLEMNSGCYTSFSAWNVLGRGPDCCSSDRPHPQSTSNVTSVTPTTLISIEWRFDVMALSNGGGWATKPKSETCAWDTDPFQDSGDSRCDHETDS